MPLNLTETIQSSNCIFFFLFVLSHSLSFAIKLHGIEWQAEGEGEQQTVTGGATGGFKFSFSLWTNGEATGRRHWRIRKRVYTLLRLMFESD